MISPPASPSKPVGRRARWSRLSANPDVRSVQIAVVATILVHLLLLWLAPRIETFVGREDMSRTPTDADRTFEIELAPDLVPPPKPPPQKFVEANPNAPDNVPDKTDNFAAQNQQVAQEKPTPDHTSDTPALRGDKDPDATAIVTGDLVEPAPATPPTQKTTPKPEMSEERVARRAQIPLPGIEKIKGDDTEGVGSNIAKFAPGAKPVTENVESDPNAKADQGAKHGLYYTVDPKHPQPRPTLAPNIIKVRSSPLRNNEFGTNSIGKVAYDAKWNNFGQYISRFWDIVFIQIDQIYAQTSIYPPAGSKVDIVFKMNALGEITEIISVKGGDRAFQTACISAITRRAPYGKWTEDMIALLGKEQTLEWIVTIE